MQVLEGYSLKVSWGKGVHLNSYTFVADGPVWLRYVERATERSLPGWFCGWDREAEDTGECFYAGKGRGVLVGYA